MSNKDGIKGFRFCDCISKVTVKKMSPSNEKTILRILDFMNGKVK